MYDIGSSKFIVLKPIVLRKDHFTNNVFDFYRIAVLSNKYFDLYSRRHPNNKFGNVPRIKSGTTSQNGYQVINNFYIPEPTPVMN
jgi:hypothetical protein